MKPVAFTKANAANDANPLYESCSTAGLTAQKMFEIFEFIGFLRRKGLITDYHYQITNIDPHGFHDVKFEILRPEGFVRENVVSAEGTIGCELATLVVMCQSGAISFYDTEQA